MATPRAWLSDRLDVVVGDRSLGGRGLVSVTYTARWVRLAQAGLAVGAAGLAAWFFAGAPSSVSTAVVLGVVLSSVVSSSRSRKLLLTDDVLARASVSAAHALGREVKPGRWRIEGARARVLGRELRRLHGWWTPPGQSPGGDVDDARERALLAAAVPELRAFMQASPPLGRASRPEVRPGEPDVTAIPHEPGDDWPVLPPPEPQWPVLPGRDQDA